MPSKLLICEVESRVLWVFVSFFLFKNSWGMGDFTFCVLANFHQIAKYGIIAKMFVVTDPSVARLLGFRLCMRVFPC